MITVKISQDVHNKTYFLYLLRCLKDRQRVGDIKIEYHNKPLFFEQYYELFFFNDFPVFFDLRDDISCSKNLLQYFDDFILFKGKTSRIMF